MAHQTVTTFTDGDIPVLLEQDEKNGQRFRVTYGVQVRSGLSYAQAAKEYGRCVFHSLACAGKLDQPE